jgi:Thrombospondin type 1 domain
MGKGVLGMTNKTNILLAFALSAILAGCNEKLSNSGASSNQAAQSEPLALNESQVTVTGGTTFPFSASGGVSPYSFESSGGGGTIDFSTGIFTAVTGGGTATVIVYDSAGNTATAIVTVTASSTTSPYTYSWVQGGWGACSASCGGGTQTQTVTCETNTGVAVAETFCAGSAEPATTQTCNPTACGAGGGGSGSGVLEVVASTSNGLNGVPGYATCNASCLPTSGCYSVAGQACSGIGSVCAQGSDYGAWGTRTYDVYECEQ